MKKILAVLLMIVSLVCLFSCGGNTFNKAVSQIEDYGLERFDYNSKQIRSIENDLANFGIEIDGEIERITHLLKKNGEVLTYAYVYKFENDSDASVFYNNYAKYSISKIKGNVVVFGNLQMINGIKL